MATRSVLQQENCTTSAHKISWTVADPDSAEVDSTELSAALAGDSQKSIDEILPKKLTASEGILEIFAAHPNMVNTKGTEVPKLGTGLLFKLATVKRRNR